MMVDIIKKSDTELHKSLIEKCEALRNFRFSGAGTKTRNVKEGMQLKKEIARILTERSKRARSKKE